MRTAPFGHCYGLVVVAGAAALLASAAPLSVKDVTRRVGAYVDAYGERASIVVATETYKQQTTASASDSHRERLIVADIAIVNIPGVGWQAFRDVIDVDGTALDNRRDRLLQTLLNGEGGYAEALRLSNESARFNIGSVQRNFNVPTTALFFFTRGNLDRFKFTARDVDSAGAWRIAWRETYKPTLIRTPEGRSLPSEGELLVDPSDGTVLRTVLRTAMNEEKGQSGSGAVEVSYRLIDALGMWLPATMDEHWQTNAPGGSWGQVRGHATYSNYRQFTTSARIK